MLRPQPWKLSAPEALAVGQVLDDDRARVHLDLACGAPNRRRRFCE
jgi:hypothetical protein